MKLDIFQIDAFTNQVYGGNPACVVPLVEWLSDEVLLKIAQENAVAETAFFIKENSSIHLRWFTPEIEMDLCGHATLATAHCLISHMNYPHNYVKFETQSGELTVFKDHDWYSMDFPSRPPIVSELPEIIHNSLNLKPIEVYKSRDYLLLYSSEEEVINVKINRQIFDQINLDPGGVIVTSQGVSSDFVSRFFTPQSSILEDPVTGSAHCSLIPFWAKKLGKKELSAIQLSSRRGFLKCEDKEERVLISGQARTYLVGSIEI